MTNVPVVLQPLMNSLRQQLIAAYIIGGLVILAALLLLSVTIKIWKTGRVTQMLVLIIIANLCYILN